jgi:hypothetical protein
MNRAVLSYALTHENADYVVRPTGVRVIDDESSEFSAISNSVLSPTLGVMTAVLIFDRPPDEGEVLALVVDELEITEDEKLITGSESSLAVAFAGNVDPDRPCCYHEGMRIAPQPAYAHGAQITLGPAIAGGIVNVRRNGWGHNIAWHYDNGVPQIDSVPPPFRLSNP